MGGKYAVERIAVGEIIVKKLFKSCFLPRALARGVFKLERLGFSLNVNEKFG
jgi:hypothetical protein